MAQTLHWVFILPNMVNTGALSTTTVKCMIESTVKRDGLNSSILDEFRGHLLHVGAVQDLLQKGFNVVAIMRPGGWKPVNTLTLP